MTRKRTMMWMFASVGLIATAGAGVATRASTAAKPKVTTVEVTRGDLVQAISAAGSLEAVTTVNVGSQVSGVVQTLFADYNDIVRKGQTLARLDPSLFRTQVEQAEANLVRAEADVDRLKVARDAARLALDRTTRLAGKQLVAAADLETAQVAVASAEAQVKSAQASVAQASASVNQARVNLEHTIITSPIDGIVISRAVDTGQTVAASMQAPTLFILAADLTKMHLNASIDESDVGQIEAGQPVTFRVEAYPNESFAGRVAQVRLQAVVSQNVVTYAAVIDVENPELKLKPGMTATVTVEVARRDDALTVPAAALRFRPTAALLASLGGASGGPAPSCAGVANCGTLWIYDGTGIRGVAVQTGITNGTAVEILGTAVEEGAAAVSAVTLPAASSTTVTSAASSPSTSRSPLLGSSPPPPPSGGMGGPPR
ncbi:MAG: efflux RND transporter periplasmic adaptor subunit [Vicinamibacterales bacterium]|jgi:HlyD family secretion protein|nr:efflux RND transporter periplasmic adaptor subunit [Vicinamibacterales bacterium]